MALFRLFDHARFPLLSSLLDDAALTFVDVGGRGSAVAALIPLARFANYYAAEPDADEAARLMEELPRRGAWRSVTIIREAISSHAGAADLHVTREPGMSSLLEPDHAVAARYYLASKFDVVSVTSVPTLSLDAAAERYGFTDAAFLKLDTQGTELEIVQSGARLVGGPLVAIYTEANFHPFYKGQSLFADIDSHLRRQGFALFSLDRTLLRRAGYRESVYSKRVVTWAHCLYLREPESLLGAAGDVLRRQATRLLGLALVFEFYDLAFEIISVARRGSALDAADVVRLREEIGAICRVGTRHRLRQLQRRSAGDVFAPSFRDKKQID